MLLQESGVLGIKNLKYGTNNRSSTYNALVDRYYTLCLTFDGQGLDIARDFELSLGMSLLSCLAQDRKDKSPIYNDRRISLQANAVITKIRLEDSLSPEEANYVIRQLGSRLIILGTVDIEGKVFCNEKIILPQETD
ncbi:MAG TPA: hypothetical protein VD928_02255 [Candidatus Paceibacterota bacterium]|nr:hypothetical protein [Candidatus Paceibacterota bacterium]